MVGLAPESVNLDFSLDEVGLVKKECVGSGRGLFLFSFHHCSLSCVLVVGLKGVLMC